MFFEASTLDLGEADKKKLDELDARLRALEERVKKKQWLLEKLQYGNAGFALSM